MFLFKKIIPEGDIPFTNWGITGDDFEPVENDSLACASMCLGDQCPRSGTWKAVSCTSELKYICQVDCESEKYICLEKLKKCLEN
jgi:hypothetical protein